MLCSVCEGWLVGLYLNQYNTNVSGSMYKRPENELSKPEVSTLDFCLTLGERITTSDFVVSL